MTSTKRHAEASTEDLYNQMEKRGFQTRKFVNPYLLEEEEEEEEDVEHSTLGHTSQEKDLDRGVETSP